jgi:hypothetical protein
MASGLQCPGCGHVHPAGLPEIARGDTTFRCYGCYRTLNVPEGWTGRPTPRLPAPQLTDGAPPGAGTRDARAARLAGRGRSRARALTGPASGAPPDLPTQMVPPMAPDASGGGAPAPGTRWRGTGGLGPGRTAVEGRPGAGPTIGGFPSPGGAPTGAAPFGWVAPRRTGTPVPTAVRALVWVGAFAVGLVIAAFVLRKLGVLDVNTAIDLYAGSGAGRFGILLLLLPLWAVVSATIAHFSLEALARRRRPRSAAASGPPADTPSV